MEISGRIAEWLSTGPHRVGEPGLSEAELRRAEETFGLAFPPLLRAVLAPDPRYIWAAVRMSPATARERVCGGQARTVVT